MPDDTPSAAEIDAWIDGELDLERAWAVETLLAADPPAAGRALAAMRDRTALRLAAGPAEAAPAALTASARRLGRRLERPSLKPWASGFAGGVAAAAALALGTAQLAARPVPPDYVQEAMSAYRTGLIRARMASQVETPVADAREIAGATRLRMPQLPHGWRVTDVQLFPAEDGPALQIMAQMPDERVVSVFALRADADGDADDLPSSPETVAQGSDSAAFWSDGEMSYALVGAGSPEAVDPLAERVAAEQAS